MFTSKVLTDDSRLLQESNLAARQPRGAPHYVIQATTSEGLAQGPYLATRMGFEPATFRIEGTDNPTEPPRPFINSLSVEYFFLKVKGWLLKTNLYCRVWAGFLEEALYKFLNN